VFVTAIARAIGEGLTAKECYDFACVQAEQSSVVEPVADALRKAAESPPEDYQTHQGWVLIALQNAFYQLLHAPCLEDGVVRTVMAGGDTDTNAAIAGALLGAVHGREAVPQQWLNNILSCRPLPKSATKHPRPIAFWPVDVLRLAEKLLLLGS
jgi:ADP-ribosylglycohydrolase